MDNTSLHKMMYTSIKPKKTPWQGTKSSIRIYSCWNWIDRFDFKFFFLYPNISFWPITCHDPFSGWDLESSHFSNTTQDRTRQIIQDFKPKKMFKFYLTHNRANYNSRSFLIRHKKIFWTKTPCEIWKFIAEPIWEIILLI